MDYRAPFGSTDPDASYVDKDTPGAVSGSKVPAKAIENPQRDNVAVIAASGQTPSLGDLGQLLKAFRLIGLRGDFPVKGWQAAPPGSPAEGDRYIVAASPTGAWSGQAQKIATYLGAAWTFSSPLAGLQVQYWSGRQIVLRFDGAVWAEDLASETAAGRVQLATEQQVKDATGTGAVQAGYLASYARKLAADATFFVRTDGNDANDGLSNTIGGALATIQGAVNRAFSFVPGGGKVTINVANGAYGAVNVPERAGPELLIIGNEAAPANVTVTGTITDAFAVYGPNKVTVRGVKASTSLTGQQLAGFIAYGPATLNVSNCETGACDGAAVQAYGQGKVNLGAHRFSGGALYLYLSNLGSYMSLSGIHTIPTGINLSAAAVGATNNAVLAVSALGVSYVNPSNVLSGQRYQVYLNGVINTQGGGASFFPGSGATIASGGQYV